MKSWRYTNRTSANGQIVEKSTTPVTQAYNEQVKKFRRENGSAATIPIFDTIKSSLYTTRAMIHPKLPKSLSSLIIPPHMTRTSLEENFLFCNNPAPYSVLGFSSPTALQILSDNPHWNADGTFRTSPKLFYQSYSIHTWDEFSMKSVVYAELPNKEEVSYQVLLNALTTYAQQNNISLKPQSVLIDFEMAALNSFSKTFPTAVIKGCQFHFAQNIWKKVKKYNLVQLAKEEETRRELANILALPLLPPSRIDEAFSNIVENISNISPRFLKLTDYILKTYVENPRFEVDFWNHFDLISVRPRTNNHVAGYHAQLNSQCETHPNLWPWINYIKE
ncbi:unnamed protein product [Didymodactylos carnosus]|uniref:MULE transposase domain-containing protein n=1 Tax=Didymodactylos carnosus TaxID=1234261 RepID=A0A8S2DRY6_9BILA|nr:unnamed protein product [Didymodactylos carnosus]CAF3764939.1 unnamed protein product [Didymodactylos carnosus]